MLVKEDYDNNRRTKAITLNRWKHQSNSIKKIDFREGPKVTSVYLNNVEMIGVEVNIVSQMAQLLLNSFKAQLHPQKDMKRKLILRNREFRKSSLTEYDNTLEHIIPDVILNYMKEYKTKDETMGLDFLLYRHVKEIVSNYSTYFLCAEDSFHNKNIKIEPCYDTIIGVMVIEKNIVYKSQVGCIIIICVYCKSGVVKGMGHI